MKLEHVVFFTLHDKSPEKIDELVAACDRYLREHPGILRCDVGTLNGDLKRPVNDHDYQVSLHVTFDSRQSHDAYQTAPRHLQFIEEQKGNWAKVRVFDSDIR